MFVSSRTAVIQTMRSELPLSALRTQMWLAQHWSQSVLCFDVHYRRQCGTTGCSRDRGDAATPVPQAKNQRKLFGSNRAERCFLQASLSLATPAKVFVITERQSCRYKATHPDC